MEEYELRSIPLPELDGYSISSDGRVWSEKSNQWLSLQINKGGYNTIGLWDTGLGRNRHYLVHRLVALAFIPNPDNLPEVDHIDRNRNNNTVSNLRWVSHQANCENRSQTVRTTTMYAASDHLTPLKVFNSQKEAAEYLGVARQKISDVVNGHRPHIHGYWFQ